MTRENLLRATGMLLLLLGGCDFLSGKLRVTNDGGEPIYVRVRTSGGRFVCSHEDLPVGRTEMLYVFNTTWEGVLQREKDLVVEFYAAGDLEPGTADLRPGAVPLKKVVVTRQDLESAAWLLRYP